MDLMFALIFGGVGFFIGSILFIGPGGQGICPDLFFLPGIYFTLFGFSLSRTYRQRKESDYYLFIYFWLIISLVGWVLTFFIRSSIVYDVTVFFTVGSIPFVFSVCITALRKRKLDFLWVAIPEIFAAVGFLIGYHGWIHLKGSKRFIFPILVSVALAAIVGVVISLLIELLYKKKRSG